MDTDGAGATAPYDTWAKAAQDLETALGAMSAGDILFIQGAATDTAAATRTFTVAGTVGNPVKIIGVKDGTTNTGTSVVASDLVVRGTDTLPKISTTGGSSDIVHNGGYAAWHGIHFQAGDQFNSQNKTGKHLFNDCKFTTQADIIWSGLNSIWVWINCEYEPLATNCDLRLAGGKWRIYGGVLTATAVPLILFRSDSYNISMYAFDLTALGNNIVQNTGASLGGIKLKNCKMPATYTVMSTAPTYQSSFVELIGCSDGSSKGATTSYQDYHYESIHGSITNEATIVRTGGADDSASGLFSYAMTPRIDNTLEGSCNTLRSPWMKVWVAGGANTLTVYIANDSASTDFLEDEVWVEFYTPDAGDTAQHDQNFDPSYARLLETSTAITDDTGSTWGTGGNNHQKMSATVTTGFEGEAYARLHYAKRFSSSPVTLYVDPKIAIT